MSSVAEPQLPPTGADFSTAPRLTFPRVVRSEWRKFFSLRSLVVTLSITLLIGIILPVWTLSLDTTFGDLNRYVASTMQVTIQLQSFFLLALGVLLMSNEFTKNAAITTFVTVPRRLLALSAKITVGTVLTVIAWAVLTSTTFLLVASYYGAGSITAELYQLAGWSLFYAFFYLMTGFSFALILRSSAGGITAAIGVIQILPVPFIIFASQVPIFDTIQKYLPGTLSNELVSLRENTDLAFSNPLILMLLVGYLVAFVGVGAYLLRHRDID